MHYIGITIPLLTLLPLPILSNTPPSALTGSHQYAADLPPSLDPRLYMLQLERLHTS